MEGKKILVIDDDSSTRHLIKDILTHAGAKVCIARDGTEGLSQLWTHKPDLVILDIMMPKMDGWETLEQMQQVTAIPIIVLTALPEETNLVTRGLDGGAVDYMFKPFHNKILVARVRAALRQSDKAQELSFQATYCDDHLLIDLQNRKFLVDNEPINLSKIEQKMLSFLFRNKERTVTTKQILEAVWGPANLYSPSSVHVYISRLRHKIEIDPSNPRYLRTVYGIGYQGVFATVKEPC
ncbi:response regulator transcription factor [Candidatus Leptofilum sp.]|uniref:response regulator transcription factor n=1 Tax=Candidatus Leptofilum sp. TaxID=3241576 RepID=UPI003B593C01